MSRLLFLILPSLASANTAAPAPFPVFLKAGFSSILEFEEAPTRVVLGDSQNFQVEKLERSLVVKTLAAEASTNMFVYFKELTPRLFVLVASDDAEPTYFKKFEVLIPPKPTQPDSSAQRPRTPLTRGIRIIRATFDTKKDYFVVSVEMTADAKASLTPQWKKITLGFDEKTLSPTQLWSERKEVQKDSRVKARLVFVKPNLPRNLKGVLLTVPIENGVAFSIDLSEGKR